MLYDSGGSISGDEIGPSGEMLQCTKFHHLNSTLSHASAHAVPCRTRAGGLRQPTVPSIAGCRRPLAVASCAVFSPERTSCWSVWADSPQQHLNTQSSSRIAAEIRSARLVACEEDAAKPASYS